MRTSDIDKIYQKTEQHYNRARITLDTIQKRAMLESYQPISDRFPSFQLKS